MLFLPGFYQAIGKQSCVKKVLLDSYWQIFKIYLVLWQLVVVKLDIQVQGYIFYFV